MRQEEWEGMLSFELDPARAARRKQRANRKLHTRDIPLYRVIGFCLLTFLVHLQGLVGAPLASTLVGSWFGPMLLTYSVVSWVLLLRFYGRTGRLHLGVLFLALDVPFFCAAIFLTGGESSFFVVLLLVRVADQVPAGVRRTLFFCHYNVACFALTLWLADRGGWQVNLSAALSRGAVVYLCSLYLSLGSFTAEGLRRTAAEALRTARDLIGQLENRTRELEKANRAKNQFLANTSHEIRTPLHGVLGMLDLTLDSDLTLEQRENLSAARDSARSLLRVLNDILDVARIEAGRLELLPAPFHLPACLAQTVDGYRALARARGLELSLDCAGLPERVVGDSGRLQQILRNLLDNALKFTESGTIAIQARWRDPNRLAVTIADTGCGIPSHLREAVFQPFVQADASLTRTAGGTGLGLAISRELARLMGGTLELQEAPEPGAAFRLEVPLETVPETGAVPETVPVPAAGSESRGARSAHPSEEPGPPGSSPEVAEPPASGRPLRVLVAEDNPINQRFCTRLLERWGHAVALAQDGLQALRLLEEEAFDVALLDIQMPGLDGLEVARRIRSQNGPLKVKLVAVTAHATSGYREHCLSQGLDAFLDKPLRPEELRKVLQEVAGA